MTQDEAARLRAAAVASRHSVSSYVRERLLSRRALERPPTVPAVNRDAVAEIHRIGVNLNQLTVRANAGRLPDSGEILAALEQLRRVAFDLLMALQGEGLERPPPHEPMDVATAAAEVDQALAILGQVRERLTGP